MTWQEGSSGQRELLGYDGVLSQLIQSLQKLKMKPNFRYQELTLTNTPKKGSIHQRPLSYSRSLNRTPQNESANWQASENQGEHADSEVAHSRLRGGRTILKEYPLQKDDLLKILRGTNYVLSSQKDARLPSNSRVSRATGPILIKSHRGGLCAPGFKKSSRQRNGRITARNVQMNSLQIQQNARKFLGKSLRVEKWLDISKLKVF